jgi:hypothetical protein
MLSPVIASEIFFFIAILNRLKVRLHSFPIIHHCSVEYMRPKSQGFDKFRLKALCCQHLGLHILRYQVFQPRFHQPPHCFDRVELGRVGRHEQSVHVQSLKMRLSRVVIVGFGIVKNDSDPLFARQNASVAHTSQKAACFLRVGA